MIGCKLTKCGITCGGVLAALVNKFNPAAEACVVALPCKEGVHPPLQNASLAPVSTYSPEATEAQGVSPMPILLVVVILAAAGFVVAVAFFVKKKLRCWRQPRRDRRPPLVESGTELRLVDATKPATLQGEPEQSLLAGPLAAEGSTPSKTDDD